MSEICLETVLGNGGMCGSAFAAHDLYYFLKGDRFWHSRELRIARSALRLQNGERMHRLSRIGLSWQEQLLAGMDRLIRWRSRGRDMPAHLLIGLEGEEAAFFYLRRKGYTVVARRWSSGNLRGDIDLIAWHGPLLCVIEVKTRSMHDMAPAEAKVDSHKRHMLRRLARHYVRQLPRKEAPQVRFDVVSVYLLPGVEREFVHFENAFGWDEYRDDWE